MKNNSKMTKSPAQLTPPSGESGRLESNGSRFTTTRELSPIKWPTDSQMQEVSKRLLAISKMGTAAEEKGDYFNSGDLAYQIHDIINNTAELYKKSQRLKRD